MSKLVWDKSGERFYETGVSKGVLYIQDDSAAYTTGVVWNGLTSVSESPEGAEANDFYADDIKYASIRSAENWKGTIEAYTYPDEFAECDGSVAVADGVYIGQQKRKGFGFSWVTQIGNDTATESDDGYKIHLVYGCTASPSEKSYESINDSPDAITFSWEIDSTPVNVTGHKATSTITIDSTKVDATKLATLEAKLYGSDDAEPTLPTPDEIIAIFAENK